MNRSWFGLIVATFVFFAAVAVSDEPAISSDASFPDFTLNDADGHPWRLSAYAGRPKLVLFWATWCPYCRRLMPGVVRLHEQYADQGLEVVGVNFHDDGDTRAYAQRMKMRFVVLLDGDDLAKRAGVQGTPTLFLLDGADRVVLRTSDADPDNPALSETVAALIEKTRGGRFRSITRD